MAERMVGPGKVGHLHECDLADQEPSPHMVRSGQKIRQSPVQTPEFLLESGFLRTRRQDPLAREKLGGRFAEEGFQGEGRGRSTEARVRSVQQHLSRCLPPNQLTCPLRGGRTGYPKEVGHGTVQTQALQGDAPVGGPGEDRLATAGCGCLAFGQCGLLPFGQSRRPIRISGLLFRRRNWSATVLPFCVSTSVDDFQKFLDRFLGR